MSDAPDTAVTKPRLRKPVDRSRRGRIVVDRRLMERDAQAMRLLMSRIIIVRAEMLYDRDGLEYIALSDRFDPVPPGQMTPDYEAIFSEKPNAKLALAFRKVTYD